MTCESNDREMICKRSLINRSPTASYKMIYDNDTVELNSKTNSSISLLL